MKKIILIFFIYFPLLSNSQTYSQSDSAILKKYFETGIPVLDKAWLPEEYIKSIKILITAFKDKTLELPNNKNISFEVLKKITDIKKYWFLESDLFNDKEKMFYILDIQTPLSELSKIYIKNSKIINKKISYSNEIILLQEISVMFIDKELDFTDKFLLDNPNLSETQKEGFKKMKYGLNTLISGAFITIDDEYLNYNEQDICSFSDIFFNFYKNKRDSIDENARNEFDKKKKTINLNHKLECVRQSSLN